jgi:hypothetical protein
VGRVSALEARAGASSRVPPCMGRGDGRLPGAMTPIQVGLRRAHTQATQQAELGDTLPGTHMPIVLRTSMIPTPARTYSLIHVKKPLPALYLSPPLSS